MLFFSLQFLVFYALVFCAFWTLKNSTHRKLVLLLSSYIFYAAWDVRFLSLIIFSTLLDFYIGRALGSSEDVKTRKQLVLVSIAGNLGVLFFFKYFNFFTSSLSQLLNTLSIPIDPLYVEIILPVGISFYTFQTLSYTIDVYRRKITPSKNILDIAVFVAFFPQLVAGPIVRAADFLPQLNLKEKLSHIPWKASVTLFLIGLFKKVVIADSLALYIDPVFASPTEFNAFSVILAVVLFAIQIYCDFSGYSDMAIALARLLGFNFPLNFYWPYFSENISDFWRRWHISLSSWLRDYLYISLGGNRSGELLRYRNLMLTMILGGLWHGASWNFLIWGALHGIALAAFHLTKLSKRRFLDSKIPKVVVTPVKVILTFWWVCLTWIFFRAQDLQSAVDILTIYLTLQSPGVASLSASIVPVCALLLFLHLLGYKVNLEEASERIDARLWAMVTGVFIALTIMLTPETSAPFIYFQF